MYAQVTRLYALHVSINTYKKYVHVRVRQIA